MPVERRHVHVRGHGPPHQQRDDAARRADESKRRAPVETEAISTDNGLPSTEPTAQPIISFAASADAPLSGTSMLTVAATCGV